MAKKSRSKKKRPLGAGGVANTSRPPNTSVVKGTNAGREGPRIAIIGGGTRCEVLLEMLAADRLKHLKAKIIGVADINPQAPGFVLAKEQGIYTTADYRDLPHLEDLL